MSWFATRSAGVRKETSRPPTVVEPDVHRSLALASLFDEIRGRKVTVLDLGSAVGSNVDFFSQYGCKLYIEDLYSALTTRVPSGDGDDLVGAEFFTEFLAIPDDTRFDVVLAWDRFNYLHRKELARFGEKLRRHTQPGALVFALISYHKQIPAQPHRFRIQDEETLVYERRTAAERPSPRFAPSEVTGLLKGFRVDRSFLLRHGIQENLLERE